MSLSGIIEETHSHLCDLPGFLLWDYPGSPVIKIPHFHFRRHGGIRSLVRELRSHMPLSTAKKKRKKEKNLLSGQLPRDNGCQEFLWWLIGKESTCQCRRHCSIPHLRRPPGEGNSNPTQYSFLGNPIDRGAWQAIVHGIAESDMI